MKDSPFLLYIDRLKNDDTENICVSVTSQFLEIDEPELHFQNDILVSGKAYLAKNHIILDLKIHTLALLPCSICNEMTEIPIKIDDIAQTIELCEIKSSIYDYAEEIRSSLLLKIPPFVECHHGHCPSRKNIEKYLKADKSTSPKHSPFANL